VRVVYIPYAWLASGKWVVDFGFIVAVVAEFAGIRVGKCLSNI